MRLERPALHLSVETQEESEGVLTTFFQFGEKQIKVFWAEEEPQAQNAFFLDKSLDLAVFFVVDKVERKEKKKVYYGDGRLNRKGVRVWVCGKGVLSIGCR